MYAQIKSKNYPRVRGECGLWTRTDPAWRRRRTKKNLNKHQSQSRVKVKVKTGGSTFFFLSLSQEARGRRFPQVRLSRRFGFSLHVLQILEKGDLRRGRETAIGKALCLGRIEYLNSVSTVDSVHEVYISTEYCTLWR